VCMRGLKIVRTVAVTSPIPLEINFGFGLLYRGYH
jgi:hypothetical protein